MNGKKFNIMVILITVIGLMLFAVSIIIVDPFFHYHAPLEGVAYVLDNERYQNDGIVKHFSYDAIITGTSMTQNFKTSELDKLFGVNSIKVAYSGGVYKEIDTNLRVALKYNPEIKIVIRSLDDSMLLMDKDAEYQGDNGMGFDYPTYLLDSNIFNDVNYFLNKSTFFKTLDVIDNTEKGIKMTSFDDYANWMEGQKFGKEIILQSYSRPNVEEPVRLELTEGEKKMVKENVQQNIVDTVKRYPDTTFYLFFPPYSIYCMDNWRLNCILLRNFEAQEVAIEELLECKNVKIFSFYNCYDIVCNVDNYKDIAHYGEWINSEILLYMREGEYQLTKDNYKEYLEEVIEFYYNYDYDSLY